jgi:hypothetical protein
MELGMRESGRITRHAGKESSGTLMAMFTRVSGRMTKPTVLGSTSTLMEPDTKGIGKTTSRTGSASRYGEVLKVFIVRRADGSKYEGSYQEGKKHGKGTYTWNDQS